ncbi:signal transduction histidine kinase [Spongiibacter sp. IMCC21906]|uniref:sensor histidine kinase n=1 Tax=Spongiibacter sp. IMCC21906 TaxID=1620392 RepID=UPI00062E07E0|nr:sensor histidine kinase [Spongiibacter sp. IMCC21906]AKH69151.1 signal transduction histidine kinase [Spongiibacter sp. IMCC21906]
MSLPKKLLITLFLFAVIPVIFLGLLDYIHTSQAQKKTSFTELSASTNKQQHSSTAFAVTDKDSAEVLLPTTLFHQQQINLFFWFCMASLVAAIYVSKRIYAPFKTLETMITRIKQGDINERLPENYRNTSLQNLAIAFNHVLNQAALREHSSTEKTTQQIQKLELAKANAEEQITNQNKFLANISHDLRTPINGILGINSLLENTPLDARQQEYLRIVNRSARSLLETLNDVLDLSKLQAETLIISKTRFNLIEMVNELIEETKVIIKDKDIQLRYEVEENGPEWLISDSFRIKQMLSHLLNNAVKFTDSGDITLYISTTSDYQNQTNVKFSVSDTGVGIPLKKQQAIIDAVAKTQNETNPAVNEIGLGLKIVSKMIKLMEGDVGLESQVGKGSNIYICLPVTIQKNDFSSSPKMRESNHDNQVQRLSSAPTQKGDTDHDLAPVPLSILIAEDNHLTQQLLLDSLSARGHKLTLVDNGLAAIKAFESGHFDQILIDVKMPVKDGFQAAEKIREIEDKTGHPIPIIALTDSIRNGGSNHYFHASMSHCIAKPGDLTSLIQKIEGNPVRKLPDSKLQLHSANEDTSLNIMILDKNRLSDITRGNQGLMQSIVRLFLDELPEMLSDIDNARGLRDPQKLSQAIHRLKSALGNFVHTAYYQEVAVLESLAITLPFEQWETQWQAKREQLDQLISELNEIAEQ